MKRTLLAALLLFSLGAYSQSTIKPVALDIQTYEDPAGFLVNSHLIVGKTDAILVDAQFTNAAAKMVADGIESTGKNLKTIFITHGHPDHYFGLTTLVKRFPHAQVLATPEVIADIKRTAQGKIDYWKSQKVDVPSEFIVPAPMTADHLDLEGHKFPVTKYGVNESDHSATVYVPEKQSLITGDLVYGGVHLWLVEGHGDSWLAILEQFKSIPATRFYTGHGKSFGQEIITVNQNYIKDFLKLVSEPNSSNLSVDDRADVLTTVLATKYPFSLNIIAKLSFTAELQRRAK